MKLAIALAATLASFSIGGCKKQDDKPPPPVMEIKPAELRRGQDACKAYVEKLCKCAETVEKAKEPCTLAKAYPDAIDVAMQTVGNTKSKSDEVKDAAEAIRKTMKTCIEEAGALPSLGCAP